MIQNILSWYTFERIFFIIIQFDWRRYYFSFYQIIFFSYKTYWKKTGNNNFFYQPCKIVLSFSYALFYNYFEYLVSLARIKFSFLNFNLKKSIKPDSFRFNEKINNPDRKLQVNLNASMINYAIIYKWRLW